MYDLVIVTLTATPAGLALRVPSTKEFIVCSFAEESIACPFSRGIHYVSLLQRIPWCGPATKEYIVCLFCRRFNSEIFMQIMPFIFFYLFI